PELDTVLAVVATEGGTRDTNVLVAPRGGEWIWLGLADISVSGPLTVDLVFPNSGENPRRVYADVVKVSAYLRDRDLALEPEVIDLGEVSILDSISVPVLARNLGLDTLQIFSVTLASTGENILSAPLPIPPMSSRTLQLPLRFTWPGPIVDTLVVRSDDPVDATLPVPLTGIAEPFFLVLDNDDGAAVYQEFGEWHTSNAQAYGPSSRYSFLQQGSPGAGATFTGSVPQAGIYDIYEIVPVTQNASQGAQYRFWLNGLPVDSITIDQNEDSGTWVRLQRLYLAADFPLTVEVRDPGNSPGGVVLRADAIKLQQVSNLSATSEDVPVPDRITLFPPHPNPFNQRLTIPIRLLEERSLTLDCYTLRGQWVTRILNRSLQPGSYTFGWNGTNDRGQTVSSGVYVLVLRSGTLTRRQKVLLLK
ncbi:MAG: hypothetical protein D6762_05005, partial [Candidatus Neomarinimicrobiota bacterium]